MWADLALSKLLLDYDFKTVLDYGCGKGAPHREAFEDAGKRWAGYDRAVGWICEGGHVVPDATGASDHADCLWMSHVAEHFTDFDLQMNMALEYLTPGGVLAITVPPHKEQVVGGHVSMWNAGLLLYRLALLRIDCSKAAVKTYGYNISVIVRTPERPLELPDLNNDRGDIEKLAHLLPEGCRTQGFNGNISELNWG